MKIKSEKGFTGIDIAIAIAVLFIFVALIATLIYNFNNSSKELELKSKAIEIAVKEIEKMKGKTLDTIEDALTQEGIQFGTSESTAQAQEIEEGYYRKVIVEDYNDINPNKTPDVVKRVRVQIQYQFNNSTQTVELSILLVKET